VLDTDASDNAVGAVPFEIQHGQEKVIAYASRSNADAESRYCITRKELLAVVYRLRQFRAVADPGISGGGMNGREATVCTAEGRAEEGCGRGCPTPAWGFGGITRENIFNF